MNLLPQLPTSSPEAETESDSGGEVSSTAPHHSPEVAQRRSPRQRDAGVRVDKAVKAVAAEPAPDPTDYDNLWDRLRAGYKLDFTLNPRINAHLDWYSRNQSYLDRVTKRASRYMHYIVNQLEASGLPLELALLPVVESAFNPFAYSHGRASGIWQFIPETGTRFGLVQNWWYDGRRDVEASTRAAIQYLTYLNNYFKDDWLLALAAYNTGEGNVQKAILENRRKGKPIDFWSLKLPPETRAYVPQLLALSRIVDNPDAYKLTLPKIPNRPYFIIVDIDSQIDLAQAAKLADVDIDELYLLNPGYSRWATDPMGTHNLLLPVSKAAVFARKLSAVPLKQRIGWERYKVKSGDSLLIIAQHFNTSVNSLKKANKLSEDKVEIGQMLMIPVATQPAKHYAYSVDQRLRRKKIRSRSLSRPRRGATRVDYRVKAGDTFWEIAQVHGVKARDIARWNGMSPRDSLREGQSLIVWTRIEPESLTEGNTRKPQDEAPVIRKVAYQVRAGDSLAGIAGKFNLTINDIMKWNTINNIHPGQSLTLFVDVTRVN